MCEFSNLKIGEGVNLIMDEMFCTKCGTTNKGATLLATYLGHSVDGLAMKDCFSIVSFHACQSCGRRFVQYQQPCGNYGSKQEIKARESLTRD